MKREELLEALRWLKVETGSLACLGCGHEHNCSVHGCAIIREAEKRLLEQQPPAADEAPVRHGRWAPSGGFSDDVCSACGEAGHGAGCADRFCPGCGARMDL